MNKKLKLLIVLVVCVIGLIMLIVIKTPNYSKEYSTVVGEWEPENGITGQEMSKHFGDSDAYEIGANSKGMPVFKNPDKAFRQVKIDYKEGIKAIKKELGVLLGLTKMNFRDYQVYGCQLTNCTEEESSQGRIISSFLDIYENSFDPDDVVF